MKLKLTGNHLHSRWFIFLAIQEKGCPVSARTALIFVIDLIFFTAKLDMYDSVVITNQIVTAH